MSLLLFDIREGSFTRHSFSTLFGEPVGHQVGFQTLVTAGNKTDEDLAPGSLYSNLARKTVWKPRRKPRVLDGVERQGELRGAAERSGLVWVGVGGVAVFYRNVLANLAGKMAFDQRPEEVTLEPRDYQGRAFQEQEQQGPHF